ncbi:DUF3872 domain-containing protein [Phocaeicola barnesiae]
MKRMTELIFTAGFVLIAAVLLCACSDKLDIRQAYEFDLATLPVQTDIVQGEEAEIRCQLVRSGRYEETEYFIRYFQPDGKGELRMENGTVLAPNDLYPLPGDTFRLYYRSLCTDQQTIDIYIVDSFGQTVTKSFSFNSATAEGSEDSAQPAI